MVRYIISFQTIFSLYNIRKFGVAIDLKMIDPIKQHVQ